MSDFSETDVLVSGGSDFSNTDIPVNDSIYSGIDDVGEVSRISNDVWNMSLDFGVPLANIEDNYITLTAADPSDVGEPVDPFREQKFEAAPPKSKWNKFKDFFVGQREPLPPNADRMEKIDRAIDTMVGTPLRTALKFANGKLFGAGDIMWGAVKRALPEDMWEEEVKDMTLTEAMDHAMGYEPSTFASAVGGIAEFSGRINTAQDIGMNTGILGNTPKDAGAIIAATETAKLFGLAEAANQISKLAATVIDPTETEYGFEGPKAVLRDMSIGALFSFAHSGAKGVWSKLTPTEKARALKVLGLKKNATADEIKSAARELAKQYHPDKVSGFRKDFEAVINARDKLITKAGELKTEQQDMVFRGQNIKVKPRLLAEPKPAIVKAPKKTVKPTKPALKLAKPVEGKVEEKRTLFHGGPIEKGGVPSVEKSELTDIRGVFFTEDADTAKTFGEREGREGIVQQFEVDIKNPATGEIAKQIEDELRAEGVKEPQLFTAVTDELLDRGFDAVIRESGTGDEIIVLKDEAITTTPTTEVTTKVPQQTPSLAREAGVTTIIPDVVTEVTEVSKKLGTTSSEVVKAGRDLFGRNTQRYTTELKRQGKAGQKVAKDLDEITQRAQVKINNSSADAKLILKGVNKENRELIAKTINGKVKNPPKWIQERADNLRNVLDEILNDAKELGVQRLVRGVKIDVGGSGKAFPQVPNAEGERMLKLADTRGFGIPEVLIAAQDAVAAGKVKTPEEYLLQLKEYRKAQLRGVSGYLERTRVELPEEWVEWDPDRVLAGLFQTNWTFLEGARQWGIDSKGQSFPKLAKLSETIRVKEGTDASQNLDRFIKAAFGQELTSSEAARNISAAARGYQFLTKIAVSPLTITRNMLDRFTKVSAWAPLSVQLKTIAQYPPFVNTFLKHSKELETEMIRRGAVFSNTAIAEGYEPGKLLTKLAGKAFSASELGNQVYIALAKRNAIEENLKLLKQNPKIAKIFDKRIGKLLSPLEAIGKSPTQAASRLRELGNEELLAKLESSEDISPELLNAVLHRTVRDNAFPVVLSTKRLWWDNHPFARVLTQFKVWGTEQVGHIWNDVIKKTVRDRDPSLMIRWLTTMAVMGEIYNIIRDFILGKDESLLSGLSDSERRNAKDISVTILKDIVDGGGVGILADLLYGLPNFIGGPTAATIANFADASAKTVWNPKQAKDALKQLAIKETPAAKQARGVLDKIDAQNNINNLTQDYYKVRRKAFEWSFNKKHPTSTKKAQAKAVQAMFGWIKRIPTERTLSYELAQRSIMVGDVESASDHIFFLLRQAGRDFDKIVSIEEGIKSSLNNSSPLGRVADKDLDDFFRSMNPQERREATQIQMKWDSNAAKALDMAITKWEKWDRGQR
jgi:hypothetical protein